ncbi:ribosomal protein subunit L28 [Schizosaccharomyces japonicus yFS275]|uniref:Large ribosomal subunit protein mL40 n=1 Tax=Schizosaccharomyces japonicus (strain yFS275 / FY16936) TaxID=402676 RepID=B6K6Z2_SCHJY|nr:ribosomal protein subunit L28 [Schizosaccharomyces japonicus yFS275]EEB09296.1 ribosomal protein subunit L28 [Schizosaccharomyces japonicus yFS275]
MKTPKTDAVFDMLRRILYESPGRKPIPMDTAALRRHEYISLAWNLSRQEKRCQQSLQLRKQYQEMQRSCQELYEISRVLFDKAMAEPKERRFPVDMRIPTETPPRSA